MAENSLVKKNLNFFQRIRKTLYLRGLNEKKIQKYILLPDYLKQDEEIVNAVINEDERYINRVPVGMAKDILKQTPHLLKKFYNIRVLNQIFNEIPELIKHYEGEAELNNIYNLIYNNEFEGNREFIKYLSKDLQMKLLAESIEYEKYDSSGNQKVYGTHDEPKTVGGISELNQYLNAFSEDAIIALACKENLRIQEAKKKFYKDIKPNRIEMFNIHNLSEKIQLKLLLISSDFDSKVSEDVLLKFVNGNPLLFDRIPDELKKQMVYKNPEILAKMPQEFQKSYLKTNPDAFKNSKFTYGFNIKSFKEPEEAIEKIAFMGKLLDFDKENITEISNSEYIWEMGQFDPELVRLKVPRVSSDIACKKRNEYLVRNFYEHVVKDTGENELTKFLERILLRNENIQNELYTEKGIDKLNRMAKIILNEDILKVVPATAILDYVENPDHKKLIEIIRQTYGETSVKILEDRPKITMDLIPNLYIFKPEIVKEFGIGAVHANLSYNMSCASGVLSEIARKPELMQQFMIFNETMQEVFPDTAVGLQDKLTSFIKCKKLMKSVDFRNLTDELKENLQIALMDSNKKLEPELVGFPKNLEELETYYQKRNDFYSEAIKKETNPQKIKQFISRMFFGVDYNTNGQNMELQNPSVLGMVNFYHLGKFVNNPITLQGGEFSEEELDSLELLEIFSKIEKPEILIELADKLANKEDVINPIMYRSLQEKVPMQYSKEMVNALLTPEKAMKMIEDGAPGIEMKVVDGIKVIFLKGVDFKLYVSNPFMNNSGVGTIDKEILAKEWKEKENGVSTFSGCVIDQAEVTSCVNRGDYGLGFGNISPYQIIGMGTTDIHVSHERRMLSPNSSFAQTVSYDYPEEFMRKFSRRLNGEDPYNDTSHQYDEMASSRTEKYLSKIKEGTFGGKILSDYIFKNGTDIIAAVDQAKKCGIEFVFAYDEEKHRYVDKTRLWRKPEEHSPRKETEFMAEINRISRGDEVDER